jgi:protein arginine N-methyltransferase 1
MSLVVDAHRAFLSDRARLAAYEAAIRQIVRPGDVVVDLGAGSGILGLFACRAGAARVYAVEPTGLIEFARAIAADNGVADRIRWVHKPAAEVDLPERADVLVGDFAGRMGFDAGVFEFYALAPRWLKPTGRAIPSHITIEAAPVDDPVAHANAAFWESPVAGFRMAAALTWSFNTGYPVRFDAAQLVGSPVAAAFATVSAPALLRIDGTSRARRNAVVHGVGAWFSAVLADGVEMTNAPGAPRRIERRNVFLPLETPVAVAAGDTVRVAIRIRPADRLVTWSAAFSAAAGAPVERHSTLNGMLISREDLRATDPSLRPRLTPRGEGRRTVLELCDGARPLHEIERAMLERHPSLFATPAEAEAFVAEVLTRYAEFD